MKKAPRVTVWILEETSSTGRSLRAIFEIRDVVVHQCNGNRGLSFECKPGAASCFVLNASMPDITPAELILLLRKEGIRLPVFILTEKGREVLLERVARYGICTVLNEP